MHSSIDPKFGEITLSAWTTRQRKYRKGESGTNTTFAAPPSGGPVHETSKKIGGHCIRSAFKNFDQHHLKGRVNSFGERVRVKRTIWDFISSKPATHHWERINRLASFSFKYRPLGTSFSYLSFLLISIRGKALLQANGIAPLPPTVEPTSTSSKRSPEPVYQRTEAHPVDTREVDFLRVSRVLVQLCFGTIATHNISRSAISNNSNTFRSGWTR